MFPHLKKSNLNTKFKNVNRFCNVNILKFARRRSLIRKLFFNVSKIFVERRYF